MKKDKLIFFSIIVILSVFAFLAVTPWSLWLDETMTARMYSSGSFSQLIEEFRTRPGSETQMPGWIFTMWTWVKIFGNSEYALRTSNWLFLIILFIYSGYLYFRKEMTSTNKLFLLFTLIITVLNPFILYNLNEARCNIPMYMLAMMSILGLWSYYEKNIKGGFTIFLTFYFLSIFFNLLSSLLLFGLLTMALCYSKNIIKDIKDNRKPIIITVTASVILFIYYFTTLLGGKGGVIESPGIGNIGYTLYEFLGFSGLGPSKNILREAADKKTVIMEYAPYIALLVLAYITLFFCLIKEYGFKFLMKDKFLKSFLVSFAVFFLFALFAQFRFWGRHAMFLYPFLILFMVNSVIYLIHSKTKLKYLALLLYFGMISFSSFNILFNDNYKKENMRLAASKTLEFYHPGELIIWPENEDSAWYYGLVNDSINIKNDFPERGDTGILVYFNRLFFVDPENKIPAFIESSEKEILFTDKDFTIYRIYKSK